MPGPLLLSCLSGRDEWPTTPVFGAWRAATPASFEAQSWGTYPPGGGFSFRSSWKDVTLPKAVEWLPVPSHVERADTSVKRGNVFTHDPSPCNPYVIQLSRYYRHILSVQAKSGNTGLKPHTPHHGLKNRGLRRAKTLSVSRCKHDGLSVHPSHAPSTFAFLAPQDSDPRTSSTWHIDNCQAHTSN